MNTFERNGIMYADSREAAELLQVRHGNLIALIQKLAKTNADLQEEIQTEMQKGRIYRICMTKEVCDAVGNFKLNNAQSNKTATKQFILAYHTAFQQEEQVFSAETKSADMPENQSESNMADVNELHLQEIVLNGQRVLTTAQLAEAYGTDSKVISWNFNHNIERYIESKHFYCLTGEELKAFREIHDLPTNIGKLYLWTERGAFLHAKSLNNDKAWEVYENLVEFYFDSMTAVTKLAEQQDSYMIEDKIERAKRWIQEEETRRALQLQVDEQIKQITMQTEKIEKQEQTIAVQAEKITVQEKTIEEQKPKAEYCDSVLLAEGLITPTMIAKDYGRSAQWLNAYLHKKKVQFKKNGVWYLYQPYAVKGYAMTKTVSKADRNGIMRTYTHTNWNQEGRMFIYELLKADGILPVSEQKAKAETDESRQIALVNE